jgi:hypothetical protein
MTYLCEHCIVEAAQVLQELLIIDLVYVLKHEPGIFLLLLIYLEQVGFSGLQLGLVEQVVIMSLLNVLLDPRSSHFLDAFRALQSMSVYSQR